MTSQHLAQVEGSNLLLNYFQRSLQIEAFLGVKIQVDFRLRHLAIFDRFSGFELVALVSFSFRTCSVAAGIGFIVKLFATEFGSSGKAAWWDQRYLHLG